MSKPLRICIDARLKSGHHGGVEQVVIGLAAGLTALEDGDEEIVYLVNRGDEAWLLPYIAGPEQLLFAKEAPLRRGKLQTRLEKVPGMKRAREALSQRMLGEFVPPDSDGTIESAEIDLMHFTWQSAFTTDVPSIYHPHDLQHVHLPQFFNKRHIHQRDQQFRYFCEHATMVASGSTWSKNDFMRQYGLPDEKVKVIQLAPPSAEYGEISAETLTQVRNKLQLADQFLFYPAQTWPHKNHDALFQALAQLRDSHQLTPQLILTGRINDHADVLREQLAQLNLREQVRFLGFVSTTELKALYELASVVVIPTRFEAGSFPMWEAFAAGTPVASSNVTSLPEQAGDAALLFDPDDIAAITDAIYRLLTDDALCDALVARATERVQTVTWERTARLFRAHYRRLMQRPLTNGDKALLAAAPTM